MFLDSNEKDPLLVTFSYPLFLKHVSLQKMVFLKNFYSWYEQSVGNFNLDQKISKVSKDFEILLKSLYKKRKLF